MHGRGSYAIPAPQLSPDHQQLEISSVCSLGLPGTRGFLPRYSRQKVYVPTQALGIVYHQEQDLAFGLEEHTVKQRRETCKLAI